MRSRTSSAIAIALVLVVGCKGDTKKEPAPEPAPAPAPVSPMPTPTPVAEGCEMKISMSVSGLDWSGPHSAGGMADGIDPAKVKEAAKQVWSDSGPCTAVISADDKVVYQDVIAVMDGVISAGIRDVALDIKGAKATSPKASTGGDLKSMPIVAVTADAVMLNGVEIGKLADATLDAALAKAYADAQKKTPGSQLILQADRATTWANLARIVGAAKTAGFPDVLFAVKNQ